MKRTTISTVLICLIVVIPSLLGCATVPKETVELNDIVEAQATELQRSHVRIIQLYYAKLRDDINSFIDNEWMPLFLSKVVQNEDFRKDLDDAYLTSGINPTDLKIEWQRQPLNRTQEEAIIAGLKNAVTDERAKLGRVLLDFSAEAQRQINMKRQELLRPIDEQERLLINEINAAYADLYSAQASIKAFLSSAVELKQNQERVLQKLEVLEESKKMMDTALEANESLTGILKKEGDAEEIIDAFLKQVAAMKKQINEKQ